MSVNGLARNVALEPQINLGGTVRSSSFKIIGFSHLYCWSVGCAGYLFMHRERVYREKMEIEKDAEKTKITKI